MTIEECMRFVDEAITQTKWAMRANIDADEDEQTQWAHVEHKTDIARRAILALVAQARDEEAEACAEVCANLDAQFLHSEMPGFILEIAQDNIRARIAARTEGGKHDG